MIHRTYTSDGRTKMGSTGKVCVYSNGIHMDGYLFEDVGGIAQGNVSGFQDHNTNVNITSYRRIYCVSITLSDGTYSYECTQGFFIVSFFF